MILKGWDARRFAEATKTENVKPVSKEEVERIEKNYRRSEAAERRGREEEKQEDDI